MSAICRRLALWLCVLGLAYVFASLMPGAFRLMDSVVSGPSHGRAMKELSR